MDNTTAFALVDPHSLSNFKWDNELCEFYDTIKFLGGQRTRNFIRGPGFVGTGQGGIKNFDSFADFNLGGPSTNTSKRSQPGYTTKSGIIKPHLQSLLSFCDDPNANVGHIIDTKSVKVIPVSVAMDGTALKPGLEFDTRRKCVVGMLEDKSLDYVKAHPIPKASEMRENLVTSANVMYATAMDNGASMPVGVDYLSKRVSGEQIFEILEKAVKTIQICRRCLSRQNCMEHVLDYRESNCHSTCRRCMEEKAVCLDCANQGQVSHIPSLRACSNCIADGVKCCRTAVIVVVSDCEACNKKALIQLNTMRKEGSLPAELSLVVALPDVVHVGKSIKCSWANWFILLHGQRSNLVLVRTLRDCSKPEIRKKLRKFLRLDCVRNKDRMDVDAVILLTRTEVVNAIATVPFVVHTLMPEKYRYWKSNMPGLHPHPVAITVGPPGKLLVLDYDPEKKLSKLLLLRLHNPVDVTVLTTNLVDARSLCFSEGVTYIAERGAQTIRFIDLEGSVTLKVSSLLSRTQVAEELQKRQLSVTGILPVLKRRLEYHLKVVSDNLKDKNVINLEPKLRKPTALCFATPGILICADDGSRKIVQISLAFDGVTVNGEVSKTTPYPPAVNSVQDLTVISSDLYFTGTLEETAGTADAEHSMYKVNLEGLTVSQVRGAAQPICVSSSGGSLIFTDSQQVKKLDPTEGSVSVIAGTGQVGNEDGTADCAKFTQLQGICAEGDNIYVTDAATGSVKLITGLSGTVEFLQRLGQLYDSFGIHTKGVDSAHITISEARANVGTVHSYFQETVRRVKDTHNLGCKSTNGPEGTISSQTQDSLKILKVGMEALDDIFKEFPGYDADLETLLTTMVENLHAVSHFKNDTFSLLTYAMDFGFIVKESLKRATKWSAKYFTHPSSYYPVPNCKMRFAEVNYMTPLPSVEMPKESQQLMRDWVEPFRPVRQRTVRSETTKDKAGTLPPTVYVKEREYKCIDLKRTDSHGSLQVESHESDKDAVQSQGTRADVSTDTTDKGNSGEIMATDQDQVDEYETDSDSDMTDVDNSLDDDELALLGLHTTTVSRSGRTVRAALRLDL